MLTNEQWEEIFKLYAGGNSIGHIAKTYGHKNLINRRLREEGIGRTKNRFNEETELKIIEEYNTGQPLSVLGDKYGCDLKTIGNILERHGIDRRNRGNSFKEADDNDKQIVKKMWDEGKSRNEIRKKLEVGNNIIDRWLEEIGEKPEVRNVNFDNHPNWKGGKIINGQGYVMILLEKNDQFYEMTNNLGYILEHRYVMAKHLGRVLTNECSIHHIDGNRQNNLLENLEYRKGQHGTGKACCCGDCGSKKIVATELQRTDYSSNCYKLPEKSDFSTDEEKEIVKKYKERWTIAKLARKFNIGRIAITNILKRYKCYKKSSGLLEKLDENQILILKTMWNDKKPKKEIAAYFGISEVTLGRWVRKLALPARRTAATGEKHGSWKGGRREQHGYMLIRPATTDKFYCMSNCQGYIPEHRYVMAQHLDRPLLPEEKVHHIDGDKQNNKIENLQLVVENHGKWQAYKCSDCGSINIIDIPLSS